MKGFVSSPIKFSDPLISCLRVWGLGLGSGASATTWQMHISRVWIMPVVVPRKEFISWSNADEENNAFHVFALLCSRLTATGGERNIRRVPVEERRQSLMLLKVFFSNAFEVKASSKSRRLWRSGDERWPPAFTMDKALCGSIVFPG